MASLESKVLATKQTFLLATSSLANNSKNDFGDVSNFYDHGYDFSRLSNLKALKLSDIEKEEFRQKFPEALKKAGLMTRSLYHNMSPEYLNRMRHWRSKVEFLINDILDLFKEVSSNNEIPESLNKFVEEIDYEGYLMDEKIELWSGHLGEGMDFPNDVPNLNGVPESHNWWTQEHRNLWKDKDP
uniref:Uncharacterized protein n=1 Tax=Panagrolaimus superbus TaxID=310955 RepID=A0A914YV68_9BILA